MKDRNGFGLVSWLVLLLVLAGAGYAAFKTGLLSPEEEEALLGAKVKRGPLRISVIERGNLVAANSATMKCEIEGRTTVLFLIEEGSQVQPGDVVCELDISALTDRRVQQDIQLQNAFANFSKAKQNHEIQISQNESDIAGAEREVEFAALDLKKFVEGDQPQRLAEAEESILLREEEKRRSEQELEWSEKLAQKGFLEQSQLDADRLSSKRAEIALTQAQRSRELLVSYEIPRELKQYEAEVLESERELTRVKLQAKARLADFTADLATSEAKYKLESDELLKLESQVEKAIIRAPVAGMVVYAVEQGSRWGNSTPMQEGTEVRERQEIISIPSTDGFLVEASIHESSLERVVLGLPCLVRIDALNETFRGEVHFKAVLPDKNSWYANPDLRVYRTSIKLLDRDDRMRPGMSSSVEILVDELADVLSVPIQSVFLDAGLPVALVSTTAGIEKRPIIIGQNDGNWVEVKEGLREGENVLLSCPDSITLAPSESDDSPRNPDWGGKIEGGGLQADPSGAGKAMPEGLPATLGKGRPEGKSGGSPGGAPGGRSGAGKPSAGGQKE